MYIFSFINFKRFLRIILKINLENIIFVSENRRHYKRFLFKYKFIFHFYFIASLRQITFRSLNCTLINNYSVHEIHNYIVVRCTKQFSIQLIDIYENSRFSEI